MAAPPPMAPPAEAMATPPPAPPPPAPMPFKINSSFGIRAGLRLQDPSKVKDMSEIHLDNAYDSTVEARFNGKVNDEFSWVVNFNAVLVGGTLAPAGGVGVMDLIAQYQPAKEFNIWAGRLLVPSDRSNFTGPFFMSPWNYPGFYVAGPPIGPMDRANGRDQGVTVWGNAADDKLKYYVGAYGLDRTWTNSGSEYYSGRISYSLQGSEPGYFGSSTYYGQKSVVTIGIGGQYQKARGGSSIDTTTGAPKETEMFMADALVEEATSGGTFTFEGQFYKYNDGYSFAPGYVADVSPLLARQLNVVAAPQESLYALLSYLTPDFGGGQIQPMVRLQQAIDPGWLIFDGALAYVIKDYSARIVATYQHVDRGISGGPSPVQNSIQLGIQLQTL